MFEKGLRLKINEGFPVHSYMDIFKIKMHLYSIQLQALGIPPSLWLLSFVCEFWEAESLYGPDIYGT